MQLDNVGRSRPRAASLALLAGIGMLGAIVAARRARTLARVAEEFRHPGLWATVPLSRFTLPLVRRAARLASKITLPAGMIWAQRTVPGTPDVRVVIFERAIRAIDSPVLLWIHGGGYVLGVPEMDALLIARILEQIDIVIVTVDYRLAPEHPFPAPLDDCATALDWIVDRAIDLGIDPARIAIGGNSAGGGLAAALVQRVADIGVLKPVLQLLLYPMLDDRTGADPDHGDRGTLMWTPASNRHGWAAYLGRAPGGHPSPAYAVPARRADLRGLPPAWIGVGTLDLFYEEDVAYAARLHAAGVPCELDTVERAYHAFDILAFEAPAVRAFHQRMIRALVASLAR